MDTLSPPDLPTFTDSFWDMISPFGMQKGPGTLRGHPTPSCSSVRRSRSVRLAAHRALGSLLAVGTSEGLHHAVTGHPGGGDCGEDRDADRHDPSCQLCQTLQHDDLLSPSWRRRFLAEKQKNPPWELFPGGLWT